MRAEKPLERIADEFTELWVGEHTDRALRTMKGFVFTWAWWQTSIVTAFERWRQEDQAV